MKYPETLSCTRIISSCLGVSVLVYLLGMLPHKILSLIVLLVACGIGILLHAIHQAVRTPIISTEEYQEFLRKCREEMGGK